VRLKSPNPPPHLFFLAERGAVAGAKKEIYGSPPLERGKRMSNRSKFFYSIKPRNAKKKKFFYFIVKKNQFFS